MKLKIAKDELEFDQKPTLNKNFWDGEKLNPEVKDAIMAVVESYLKSTNLELTIDDIDEIEFTGSLANYNYSKFSDVDIHLLFDFSKLSKDPDFMRELLTAKAIIWNDRNNVTLFGHEAELYITDAGTDHHSTGVYSVKNDEWLVKPVRDPKLSAELNLNKVKDKADKISKEIDMLVVKDELSLEKLERLKDRIKKMRVAGLETGGEFSTENLAFKLLRRRGELNTLYALMQQTRDEELSLDEDMEWWKSRRSLDNKNYRELMGHVGGKGVFKRKYAASNIGYPKSVSRKKLSKLGAPYMMDPPSKLPKSGPPGVGSLEEAMDPKISQLLQNTKQGVIRLLPKQTINIEGSKAFLPGKTYTITLKPDNKVDINPVEKTFQGKWKLATLFGRNTKSGFATELNKINNFCATVDCKKTTIAADGAAPKTLEQILQGKTSTAQKTPEDEKDAPEEPIKTDVGDKGVIRNLGTGPVANDQVERITNKLFIQRSVGDELKIFFRDIYTQIGGEKVPCLKEHSYTASINPDRKSYKVKFDGKSWDEIIHPENKFADPSTCRFFNAFENTLPVLGMVNWITGQLKKGTILRIELKSKVRPPVTYVGSEYVPPAIVAKPTPPETEGPFFRKINSIKNSKDMILSIYPKEKIFFTTDLTKVLDTKKLNYIYYVPRQKPYLSRLNKDNTSLLQREIVGDDIIKNKLSKLVDRIDLHPLVRQRLKSLIKSTTEEFLGKKTTNIFKRDEYLKKLKSSTNGKFCQFFDCKKSKIQIRGKKKISIEKWLMGEKGKSEKELYTIFIKKLKKDFPNKSYKDNEKSTNIFKNISTGVRFSANGKPIIVNRGVYQALNTASKIEKVNLLSGVTSGAETDVTDLKQFQRSMQQRYAPNCNVLDDQSEGGVYQNGTERLLPSEINKIKTDLTSKGRRIPYLTKREKILIPCRDGSRKIIEFTPEQLSGDIFRTGQAIIVNDKTNSWLEKNGEKIGFVKIPNIKNGWFMEKSIVDRWDKFGDDDAEKAEIVPGEADADVVDTEITDDDLKELISTLEQVNPRRRIQQNPKNVPSSKRIFWRTGRQIDKGFYNAVLHMKQQMIKDKVPGARGFNIGSGKKSSFRSPQQVYDNYQLALYNPESKKDKYFLKEACNADNKDFDKKLKKYAEERKRTVSAKRGTNEYKIKCPTGTLREGKTFKISVRGFGSPHQTGRAADFNFSKISTSEADIAKDKQNPIWKWMNRNAQKFGFIPLASEPWHWEMSPGNAGKWAEFGPPTT